MKNYFPFSAAVSSPADDIIGLVNEVKGKALVVPNGEQHVPETLQRR